MDDPTRERGRGRDTARPGALRILQRLSAETLAADPHAFARVDEILAEIGPLPEDARGGPALERLRERQALWQSRGIELNEEFEGRARAWLRAYEEAQVERALARVRGQYEKPVQAARDLASAEHRGRIVGFVAMGRGRLVLVDTGRLIRALRNEDPTLQVGQSVRARAHVERENERVQRIVWRIDDLEHLRRRERGRER